jgi:hypothetical protein
MAAETDFDQLVQDVLANPDRILDDDLTDEQVLELQKRLNPYSALPDAPPGESTEVVAASFTNLREDYLRRFTMTSLVGFVFRVLKEWEPEEAARTWIDEDEAEQAGGRAGDEDRTPFAADKMVETSEMLSTIAADAAASSKAADAAVEAAKAADAAAREAQAAVDTQDSADGDEAVANGKALKAALAASASAMRAADDALAKARGAQYLWTFMLRKFGQEADRRIDETGRLARMHPQVAEVIDRDPVVRPKPGARVMPKDAARKLTESFLREWFEFNPDAHVRSAHDELISKSATQEYVPGLEAPVEVDRGDPERLTLAETRKHSPAPAEGDREHVAAIFESRRTLSAAHEALRSPALRRAIAHFGSGESGALERLRRYLCPVPEDDPARAAVDVVPPQDTFHRWVYYTEANYDKLRAATEALYHEKPDLDLAISIHRVFNGTEAETAAALERFRDQHQAELISDIKAITVGPWTLLADFKQNREKANIYNKHTDILKRILDRHAEDKKLGEDLMRKRVRKLKAQNIREAGPDAEGLAAYRSEHSTGLDAGGAERVITNEEMRRLEKTRGDLRGAEELRALEESVETIRHLSESAKVRDLTHDERRRLGEAQAAKVRAEEMLEVPDDAIQVDVWTHDTGGGELKRSKFYTKAEAPPNPEEVEAARVPGPGTQLAPFAQKHLEQVEAEMAARHAARHAAPK